RAHAHPVDRAGLAHRVLVGVEAELGLRPARAACAQAALPALVLPPHLALLPAPTAPCTPRFPRLAKGRRKRKLGGPAGIPRPDPDQKRRGRAGARDRGLGFDAVRHPEKKPSDVDALSVVRPGEINLSAPRAPSNAGRVWRIPTLVNGGMPRADEIFSSFIPD